MPTYNFRHKETGEEVEKLMSWSGRNEFLEQNPDFEQIIGSTAIGDPVRLGIRRTDDGFREVLSKIGQNNYKSNLASKLSRR